MVMDKTDTEQVKSIFDLVVKTYGRIDGLVNNAGISSKVSFLNSTISDFDKIINLNLRSVYICSRTAAEYMVKQGGGAIVNIASVAARNGGGLMSTSLYAATKGGVISLTKGMARELAQYKVRVNAIAPGSIDTPMTLVGRDPAEYENTIKKMNQFDNIEFFIYITQKEGKESGYRIQFQNNSNKDLTVTEWIGTVVIIGIIIVFGIFLVALVLICEIPTLKSKFMED